MSSSFNGFANSLIRAAILGFGLGLTAAPAAAASGTATASGGEIPSWICRYHVAQSSWFIHCVDPERDDPALADAGEGNAVGVPQSPAQATEVYIPLYGAYPSSDARARMLVRAVLCRGEAACEVAIVVNRAPEIETVAVRHARRAQVSRTALMSGR